MTFNLSETKEVEEKLREMGFKTALIHRIIKVFLEREKEFIRLLKEDYDKCGFSRMTNSFLKERIDKLAGEKLI